MQMALKLNDMKIVSDLVVSCKDTYTRRQLAFMLARQQIVLDLEELLGDEEDIDDEVNPSHSSHPSHPSHPVFFWAPLALARYPLLATCHV